MVQSKKGSIIESLVNVCSGMVLAFTVVQVLVWVGLIDFSVWHNLLTTPILTVVSILRGYMWRRIFVNHFKG